VAALLSIRRMFMDANTETIKAQPAKSNFGKGIALCLIATASWGSLFPVMTEALRILDPFTFTTIRFVIAGGLFSLLLAWREGKGAFSIKGQRVGLIWFLGSLGFAGFGLLVFIGQRMAGGQGALIASVMMATQPMLSLLANWAIHRVRPKPLSFCFLLLSFCGVLLVVTKGNLAEAASSSQHLVASGIIVGGALCWVLYTIGGTLYPSWSPYRYTALTTLFGLISIVIINFTLLVTHGISTPDWAQLERAVPYLLYTAVVPGFLGVLCWNLGVRIVTPVNGVLFMDVIPVSAFTLSALQGILPVPAQVVGVVFTMSAIVLNNLYLRRNVSWRAY